MGADLGEERGTADQKAKNKDRQDDIRENAGKRHRIPPEASRTVRDLGPYRWGDAVRGGVALVPGSVPAACPLGVVEGAPLVVPPVAPPRVFELPFVPLSPPDVVPLPVGPVALAPPWARATPGMLRASANTATVSFFMASVPSDAWVSTALGWARRPVVSDKGSA